jgi:hypothetical protein
MILNDHAIMAAQILENAQVQHALLTTTVRLSYFRLGNKSALREHPI